MTTLSVDWLTMSTPALVAWTRSVGVRLPFPLSCGDVPYLAGADSESGAPSGSPRVVELLAAAFADPALIAYAVRVDPADDGRPERRSVTVTARDGRTALVLMEPDRTVARELADTEVAAGVVSGLPPLRPLRTPAVEISAANLARIDDLVRDGASSAVLRTEMSAAGFSEALIAAQLSTPAGALPTGVLGALAFDGADGSGAPGVSGAPGKSGAGPNGGGRHSRQSLTWREFPAGALLQVERTARHASPSVVFRPATTDSVFRALADVIANLYDRRTR